ncbi:hypothetical protein COL5a_003859 [Colletotrichum fioriniae]|uniref:uncharacterized protein n=1 Tax=Colletotrichum fioriniae TaxID=710243 RepID=UPI002301CFA3|nr:uncharacterized protein COL516b_008543 [Colletotrichum fioriniae]KAJ0300192.1 hypothetical protein COL516b_008543 [Colletotrichum fioriniae]KAJ0330026.1 hypothetical protein COL5a_003859 [Colletotrichum fioriniae]KAJ3949159.1 hypothetical protein N0V96_000274 [Colletotrichum fioriniae]
MNNLLPKTDAPKVGVNDAIAALPAYKSLSSFVKTDGTTDKKALENTVDEFKDLAKKSESQIEDFLWDTYNAIFAVAKQTPPEKQAPLLDFLQRLRETTVTASDGQPLKLNNQVVWKDLPTFGWVARDLWNFDTTDTSASAEEKASWTNLSAFAAQLTARADLTNPQDPFDFSLYALWALRDAFEVDFAAASVERHSIATRLAYQWLSYAPDALHDLSLKGRDFDGKSGKPGSKFADREWKGMNEARYGAWADSITSISQTASDEEVRALAKEAAAKLKTK